MKKGLFKKIIIGISLVAAAIGIGIAAYYIYMNIIKKKDNKDGDYREKISFETTNDSVARAVQFNVGQADCGLVQVSKDNKFETRQDNFNILIDVGCEMGKNKEEKQKIIDNIYNEFVSNIDLLVISHMHFDHIGAMLTLLNDNRFNFSKTIALFNWAEVNYYNNKSKLSETAKKVLKKLGEKDIKLANSNYWANENNNRIVEFSDGNYFSVLGGLDVNDNNQNAWSVVNRFEWNNQSILYTGDLAGKLNAKGLPNTLSTKHYKELDCDILKSPHHGSATEYSNGIDFLKLVTPNEIWVSVGNSDSYTLPDVVALKNYKKILPNNDVSKIKGTMKFSKSEEEIRNENIGKPEAEIIEIVNKWKPLNEFISQNPTINNNNIGYGDIKYFFSN